MYLIPAAVIEFLIQRNQARKSGQKISQYDFQLEHVQKLKLIIAGDWLVKDTKDLTVHLLYV